MIYTTIKLLLLLTYVNVNLGFLLLTAKVKAVGKVNYDFIQNRYFHNKSPVKNEQHGVIQNYKKCKS